MTDDFEELHSLIRDAWLEHKDACGRSPCLAAERWDEAPKRLFRILAENERLTHDLHEARLGRMQDDEDELAGLRDVITERTTERDMAVAENERLRELVAYREEQALDRYRDRNKARNRVNALDAELFALRARYDKLAGALEHIGRERCPHVYMDDKRPFAAYCNPCHARAALLEETPE